MSNELELTTFEEEFVESPNLITFRQKLSAVDDEEARIACQILVMDHPGVYLEMLSSYLQNMRADLDAVKVLMGHRASYETDIHGGEKYE